MNTYLNGNRFIFLLKKLRWIIIQVFPFSYLNAIRSFDDYRSQWNMSIPFELINLSDWVRDFIFWLAFRCGGWDDGYVDDVVVGIVDGCRAGRMDDDIFDLSLSVVINKLFVAVSANALCRTVLPPVTVLP